MEAWSTAAEIADAVAQGRTTAVAVTEMALARIAQHNGVLNAFTVVTAERALAKARAVDAARAAGLPVGPLAGVPFAVKNLFDVAGLPTVAGSKINRERPPAVVDAPLIARHGLRASHSRDERAPNPLPSSLARTARLRRGFA
jgi:aspartyl-tRNA(Asn)/glutamyl-tRNA(Gln) amidotransferase subunit A